MAQQKQLSWTDLRVGIFVLVGLIVAAVAVFYVTGNRLIGAKYRLVTYMPEVNGMASGAPVDLDGIAVGNVESLTFTPNPQDHAHSVTVVLQIQKSYQDKIRTDSAAAVVTQGLLGDEYVAISRGFTGSVIPNNGTLASKPVSGTQEVISRSADLMESAKVLVDNLNETMNGINRGEGSVGKFIKDPALYNHFENAAEKFDAMATTIQSGQGSMGKLVMSDDLYNKFDSVAGKADDVMTAVHDQKGTLGKLVYDPALSSHIGSIASNTDGILSDVRAGKGTLGKALTDDSLFTDAKAATANIRDATAKLNSNQGTAGKFFSDPALYDNLTGMTGDMDLLLKDFRQNPKKFLQIKLGIF